MQTYYSTNCKLNPFIECHFGAPSRVVGAPKFKGMFFILYKCSFGKANKIADIIFVYNEDKIVSTINMSAIIVSAIVCFTYKN